MNLMSGFTKHEDGVLCRNCNEYYGTKQFSQKCSYCFRKRNSTTIHPWETRAFRKKVNNWCKNKYIDNMFERLLTFVVEKNNTTILIKLLKEMKRENKFISAELGETLLRKKGLDCPEKSHLICPFVLDWWNIRNFNYHGFELCYYGRYGDEMEIAEQIKSIPPLPPNHSLVAFKH